MSEILNNMARVKGKHNGRPEAIDGLFLDAVHLRAMIYSLDSTENTQFLNGNFYRGLFICNSTYTIVMKIMKLYDRKQKGYNTNTLRETFKKCDRSKFEISNIEYDYIIQQFNTENTKSLFYELSAFRNKALAHNEEVNEIYWDMIDNALLFLARVWYLIGIHEKSLIMFPFYDFKVCINGIENVFTHEQMIIGEKSWNEFIDKIKQATKTPLK